MGKITLRKPESDDCLSIGEVCSRSWQTWDSNIIPDEYLDSLTAEECSKKRK